MQYTTNYNLKKPEGSDPVNIQDFNDNADSLDTELKKRVAVSGGDISNTKIATADNITTEFPVPSAGDTPKAFLGKMKKFAEDFKNLKTGLLTVGMLVNNCTTNNANLPLSAAQGKVLMDLYTQLNGDWDGTGSALKFRGSSSGKDVASLSGCGIWYTGGNATNARNWAYIIKLDGGSDGLMLEYSISLKGFRMKCKSSGIWGDWIEK